MKEILEMFLKAGVGNSTDFALQIEATKLARKALEAKAAPVGETGVFAVTSTSAENAALHAAYQRAQQPQSAEAVVMLELLQEGQCKLVDCEALPAAFKLKPGLHQLYTAPQPSVEVVNRAHVMDALLMWNRRHGVPPIKIGYEYGVAGAVLDLVATPQPSAGVVMPEIPWQWSKSLTHCWPDDKDDRDGDWCVGCIDEEGNFYEVVKVEASQYDAAGESQKIAEAIVALWEFARLNGKEVV